MLSTNEDGFHSNGNDVGPVIVDSTIAHNGDDNGNICSAMSVYLGQFTPNDGDGPSTPSSGDGGPTLELTFVDVARNLQRARVGDRLSFYHLNTQAFLGAVTVSAVTVSDNPQVHKQSSCIVCKYTVGA